MYILIATLIACGNKDASVTVAEPPVAVETTKSTEPAPETITEHYGAEFTIADTDMIKASLLLDSPEAYVDQRVRVSGSVSDVCQKMGCWMVISEEDKHMRITTKGHNFFVAKDGAGSLCEIEGVVTKRVLDAERTEHFKSEQSEGAPLPEEAATNNVVYEIVAEGITFHSPVKANDSAPEAPAEQ